MRISSPSFVYLRYSGRHVHPLRLNKHSHSPQEFSESFFESSDHNKGEKEAGAAVIKILTCKTAQCGVEIKS